MFLMTTTVLETMVGEGKKFQTAEQLAEAKLQADQYIDKLKSDLSALQAKVSEGGSVNAEALDQILNEIKNNRTVTTSGKSSSDDSNQSATGLTEDAIVKIIERREQQRVAVQNVETAMTQVRKVHGSKSDEFLAKLASETGQTVEELKGIAARSPSAFLRIANLGNSTQSSQIGSGSVNSQAMTKTSNEDGSIRNKAYYDAKMKEMGSKKFAFDSGLQIQMHQDMINLGESWDN